MFAEMLKPLRQEKGIGQIGLAKELNVGESVISLWRGECEPILSKLAAIADYFGMTTDFLAGAKNRFVFTAKPSPLDHLLDKTLFQEIHTPLLSPKCIEKVTATGHFQLSMCGSLPKLFRCQIVLFHCRPSEVHISGNVAVEKEVAVVFYRSCLDSVCYRPFVIGNV